MRGWPASLVEIAEKIGLAATLKLIEAYGGTNCYIPHRPTPEQKLVQVIGIAATLKLSAVHAGEHIDIALAQAARSKKALISDAKGTSVEVARRFGVSTRWVRYCRNAGTKSRKVQERD